MLQIRHHQALTQSWPLTRHHWLDEWLPNHQWSISIFDAVILLLCVMSSTAAFGDLAAKDLINAAVVLCVRVYVCVCREVLVLCDDGWAGIFYSLK